MRWTTARARAADRETKHTGGLQRVTRLATASRSKNSSTCCARKSPQRLGELHPVGIGMPDPVATQRLDDVDSEFLAPAHRIVERSLPNPGEPDRSETMGQHGHLATDHLLAAEERQMRRHRDPYATVEIAAAASTPAP